MTEESDSFQWLDNPDVVFESIAGVAVYTNLNGGVTIRQEAGPCDSDDTVIAIPMGQVDAVIAALKKAKR